MTLSGQAMKLPRLICWSLFLVGGCAHIPAPTVKVTGTRLPSSSLSLVCNNRGASLSSIRALYDGRVVSGSERQRLRYAVIIGESGQLRIDLLPSQGAFALGILVVSSEGKAKLIDSTNKQVFIADDPLIVEKRFFGGLGIDAEVVKGLITGVLPQNQCGSGNAQLYSDQQQNSFILSRSRGNFRYLWQLSSKDNAIQGVGIYDVFNERPVIEGVVEEWDSRPLNAERIVRLPKRLKMREFRSGAEITLIRMQENLTSKMSPSTFDLPTPAGYEVIEN